MKVRRCIPHTRKRVSFERRRERRAKALVQGFASSGGAGGRGAGGAGVGGGGGGGGERARPDDGMAVQVDPIEPTLKES